MFLSECLRDLNLTRDIDIDFNLNFGVFSPHSRENKITSITVYNDDRLVYSLKDGSEITVML